MKFIHLIYLSILYSAATAQSTVNLIPNPSFEDINICHKYTEPCSPKAWRSVVLKNVRYIAHEAEQKHFFAAAEGERCIAFGVFNARKKQDRSFIQVPLLEKLEAGRQYKLSFAFRPEQVMIQSIGIRFADTLQIYKEAKELINITPHLQLDFSQRLAPETWKRVETVYTAQGGEQGLIIGNFNSDEQTQATVIGKRPKGYASRRVYYAFDDFNLSLVGKPTIQTDLLLHKNFIYQDSFRHINRFGIPQVSMITKADSVNFYNRPLPPKQVKKPAKVMIAGTEIHTNEAFVASSINFANNSDQLLKSAFPTLKVVADFLIKNNTFKLKVIGHTDNVGTPFLNQKLSEDRARSVVQALIQRGVAPQQLLAIGQGESDPIADNYSEYGRQQNRRVEFIFY